MRDTSHQHSNDPVPQLTPTEHARVLTRVLASPVIKGPIIRRPKAVDLAERLDLDTAGVDELKKLRAKYGPGPVQLQLFPGRRIALLLDPDDVHRVLNNTPEPFSPASMEKRGALNHFQPSGVLVSNPEQRQARRPFNEEALEAGKTVHSHADAMTRAIREEVDALRGHLDFTQILEWEAFSRMWWRIVRRITLGDSARDDEQVTTDLNALRARGNVSYLVPKNRTQRERFLTTLRGYLDRAEPGSLAAMAAQTASTDKTVPEQQIPQWMFAFDAGSWAAFRALSLLSVAPEATAAARAETQERFPDMPQLRAVMLESLRLWPTTPLILRETRQPTTWQNGTLQEGTSIVIFAPFFHRDDETLSEAHRFSPQLWLENRDDSDWPLVPFSGGPGFCPGRNVVLLTASAVLGELLQHHDFTPANSTKNVSEPLDLENLPGTLSPFSSRFAATRR